MEEMLKLWPFIVGLAINIVAITLAFAKVRQDIAVLTNTIEEGVKQKINEIEDVQKDLDRRLSKESERISYVDKQLFAHLESHK